MPSPDLALAPACSAPGGCAKSGRPGLRCPELLGRRSAPEVICIVGRCTLAQSGLPAHRTLVFQDTARHNIMPSFHANIAPSQPAKTQHSSIHGHAEKGL